MASNARLETYCPASGYIPIFSAREALNGACIGLKPYRVNAPCGGRGMQAGHMVVVGDLLIWSKALQFGVEPVALCRTAPTWDAVPIRLPAAVFWSVAIWPHR
jgi:hypothetical protein